MSLLVCRSGQTLQAAMATTPAHWQAGGYTAEDRKGQSQFTPLPCLRGGVLQVSPGDYGDARVLAGAMSGAKQAAKRLSGRSAYFIERRRLGVQLPDQQGADDWHRAVVACAQLA